MPDLRTAGVPYALARPRNLDRMAGLPADTLDVAGVFGWNLLSTKASAPSGVELLMTAPTAGSSD